MQTRDSDEWGLLPETEYVLSQKEWDKLQARIEEQSKEIQDLLAENEALSLRLFRYQFMPAISGERFTQRQARMKLPNY